MAKSPIPHSPLPGHAPKAAHVANSGASSKWISPAVAKPAAVKGSIKAAKIRKGC